MLFDTSAFRATLPRNIQVFASGANRVVEIEGFAKLGIPVGVSAPSLNDKALETLLALQRPVMVDSGAFSEVGFTPEGLSVVSPISDKEWQARLRKYKRLAEGLGSNVLLVVPDRVGSQEETLARIATYRLELLELAALGAILLVPLQVGRLTHAQFYDRAMATAGMFMVPAMPMRKAATRTSELLDFVAAIQPSHVHLLGAGIENKRVGRILKFLEMYHSGLRITMDSNRLRAVTGRTRPLTRCKNLLEAEDVGGVYGAVDSTVLSVVGKPLDYTDLIAFPACWASRQSLAEIAERADLGVEETEHFLNDPNSFLQSNPRDRPEETWIEHPLLSFALDIAWESFVARTVKESVRTAAIIQVFADTRIRGQCS